MNNNSPFKSKLIPHKDFIRYSREKGISYVEISKLLRKQFGLRCAPSTIFAFVKVRSKKREVITMLRNESFPETNNIVKAASDSQESYFEETKPHQKETIAKSQKKLTPEEHEKEEIWANFRAIAESDHTEGIINLVGSKGGYPCKQ